MGKPESRTFFVLSDCKSAFRLQGPFIILEKFDVFYSILSHFNNLDNDMKEETWDLLLKKPLQPLYVVFFLTVQSKHTTALSSAVQDGGMDSPSKHKFRNAVKMISYLLCQFAETLEAEYTKPSTTTLTGKGRKKSSKKPVSGLDWEKERENFIQSVFQVVQLHLSRVWEPPVVEEEYVNLVANCCYKLLENPDVSRDKTTKEAIFRILGTLVKRYNHSLSASLKIIQLLQHFEHLCCPLAQAVDMFVNEFGVKSVVSEIMREIGRIDPKDLARDNSGTKAYAAFLVEMSERIPAEMLPNISVLICHLDEESYTMRNGVLSVMGEIVMRVLSKEDLEKKDKSDRDQFLDILEESFAATLPVEDLESKLEDEKKKLQEMIPDQPVDHIIGVGVKAALAWNKMEADLISTVRELSQSEDTEKQDISGDADIDSLLDGILKFLEESQYRKAVLLLQAAMDEFPGNELFRRPPPPKMSFDEDGDGAEVANDNDGDNDDNKKSEKKEDSDSPQENGTKSENQLNTDEQHLLNTLKAIYFGSQEDDESAFPAPTELISDPQAIAEKVQGSQNSEESSDVGSVVNDVSKQQVLVMYLKDCVTFAKQIRTAVPLLCKLLSSKVASDVMETVEFFVTAFECGLSNALEGVRHMLTLIWSKEQGVKDAVVAAYKRLYLNPSGNSQRAMAVAVVKNLTALTIGATVGELKSLEELISELVSNQEINSHVIQVLWERFTMKIQNTTVDESRAALILLGMAAKGDVNIARSNIDVLVNTGLGERAGNDFMLARDTCVALMKLTCRKKIKGSVGEEPLKFPMDHEMFKRLVDLMVKGIEKLDDKFWVPMAEQAINVIYGLGEHPDITCGDLIKQLINVLMKTIEQGGDGDSENDNNDLSCHPVLLTRLFAVIGHVAFRQLYHLDVSILTE
ncbi:condensin complex subunit 1-like [Ptychodera flava]|uniref:condensin complex subunit 1-like n=1 Tax=Ptychodera flava TaxID=63121 RepID=UPI003969D68F